MSRRKVQYAKRNCIDPEEEGEELPFEPRDIVIHTDRWVTDDYALSEILGRGKFGEVKKCKENSSGRILAAKVITTHKDQDKKDVQKEIEIQKELRHPKILQIYDAFQSKRQMCIVMELVEGGELFDRVVDPNFDLTERVAILFMRQIVDAMSFIHDQHILHLDMKPENIVCVAKTGTRIKIIDFGLAVRYNPARGQQVMAGTIDFMAPEVANFEDVTPATDMWSIGVICYVLVSGLSPFQGDNDNETISNILKVEYDFAAEEFEAITAGCKDFIKKLLVKDPRKRLTSKECMKHSWLQKITRAQTTRHLSKVHHLKFFVRRKWVKAITAVKAINRLERLSTLYMNRKKSGNSAMPRSPRPHRDPPLVSEPAVKYDWRSNLDERRRQRERAKHSSPNANGGTVNGSPHGGDNSSSLRPPRSVSSQDAVAKLSPRSSPQVTRRNQHDNIQSASKSEGRGRDSPRRDQLSPASVCQTRRSPSPRLARGEQIDRVTPDRNSNRRVVNSNRLGRVDRPDIHSASSPRLQRNHDRSDRPAESTRNSDSQRDQLGSRALGRPSVSDRRNQLTVNKDVPPTPPTSRQGRLAAIAGGRR